MVQHCIFREEITSKIATAFDLWRAEIISSEIGDFDRSGVLDVADVDALSEAIRLRQHPSDFNVNNDDFVDLEDLSFWVNHLKQTYFGDSNLDGEFNSSDLVEVFIAGKYETGEAAGWAEGDWNADGSFDSSDLVAAFVDGGYEQGPRAAVQAVPEPTGLFCLLPALIAIVFSRRRK